METKKCFKCGLEKEIGEFGINRAKPDGLNIYCRACTHIDNDIFEKKRSGLKRCVRCGLWKNKESEFWKTGKKNNGAYQTYSSVCKACKAKQHPPHKVKIKREKAKRICQLCCAEIPAWDRQRRKTFYSLGTLFVCMACDLAHPSTASQIERSRIDSSRWFKRLMEDSQLKFCPKCGTWKPFGDFHILKRERDGLNFCCKECNIKYVRDYALANSEMVAQKLHQKYFSNIEASRAGSRERNRIYTERHPERVRKQKLVHFHKRRAMAIGEFSVEQWDALVDFYYHEGKCIACGEKKSPTIDHVVPIVMGGSNYIYNIQPLCITCNVSKNGRRSTDYRFDGGEFARTLMDT